MAKVNITNEIIERHSAEEIVEHLSTVMRGVVQNYKVAIEKGDASLLYGCLGDITQVTSILIAMKKRNEERVAQAENV